MNPPTDTRRKKIEAVSNQEKTPHTDPMTAVEAHIRRLVLWDHLLLSVRPRKAANIEAMKSGVELNMQLKPHPADKTMSQNI